MSISIGNFNVPRNFPPMETPTVRDGPVKSASFVGGLRRETSLHVVTGTSGAEEVSVPEEALRTDDDLGRLVDTAFSLNSAAVTPWHAPE